MITVFLTYRHENSEHKARVRKLALQLRTSGFKIILDQLANEEEFHGGGPPDPNGWGGWSYAQVDSADKVLIIGSVGYFKIYENKEKPGIGLGAAIEAQRIFQQLYGLKGYNERFRVVILNDGDDAGIPDHLSGYHRFYPNHADNDFVDLVRWLKGSTIDSSAIATPSVPIVWPAPLPNFEPDIANRGEEFAFFKDLIADRTKERAIFIEAPSNHGKTALLAQYLRYAGCILPAGACVNVDFKVNPSKEVAIETLRMDLAGLLPNFCSPNGNINELRQDLRRLASPVLFIFDTYEKSSPEARELLNTLIADLQKCSALRIVVAGQIVPDHAKFLWVSLVRHLPLGPIRDTTQWRTFAARHYPRLTTDHIEAITSLSGGVPGTQLASFTAVVANLPNH